MAHLQEHSGPRRMKHTEPRVLPNSGGHSRDVSASASAAAALGWAKQKPLESKTMSQNTISPSAARAATLAVDARSPSPRGKAHRPSAFPRTLRSESPRPGLGNSAAAQAYKARSPRLPSQVIQKDSPSILAAQEAVGAARPRSVSSPVLKQPVSDRESGEGNHPGDDTATQRWEFTPEPGPARDGKTPATTLPASMFTANPPVSLEMEEKKRADELHASAVAMAKTMFKQQGKLTESFLNEGDSDDASEPAQLDQHPNLHEAAYKLAQKRLAKMHDENQRNRDFQAHYAPSGVPHRRSTVMDRFRRRASSDSDLEFQRNHRAPNRTSLLGSRQSGPQDGGRETDRAKVLEVAQKNVRTQLDDIDQNVADRTGLVPSSTKSAWESKARAVAQAKSTAAAAEEPHEGQRDVGGGLYVAQNDIEAIANQNLKPLLLELDERAEEERERERKLKEEKEAKQIEAEKRESYDKEVGGIHRKLRAEQKEKEKERQKTLKEEERARKRAGKAEKRTARGSAVIVPDRDAMPGITRPEGAAQHEHPNSSSRHTSGNADDGGSKEQGFSPRKVKSWLRAKLTRQKPATEDRNESESGKGFVGGRALRSPEPVTGDTPASSSTRGTALVGQIRHPHLEEARARTPSQRDNGQAAQPSLEREVSSGTDSSFEDARESVSPPLTPPRIIGAVNNASGSPTRDSRFVEMVD